jgi:ubiquinone/menaquinone biosynthesis C-methylase UbiE
MVHFDEQRRRWDDLYLTRGRVWRALPPESITVKGGKRVLELGCGNGKMLSAIEGEVQIVGMDHSRAGLVSCPTNLMSRVDLVQGDALHLPFMGSSLDLVVAHHLLGHLTLERRKRAMGEIGRVLRPGGQLRITVLSREDMRCGGREEVEPGTFLSGTGILTHFFDLEEVRDLASGLEEVSLSERREEKRYSGERVTRAFIDGVFTR